MIRHAEIQLLVALGNTPSRYPELTQETGLATSTVSRTVGRLESLGLIERRRDGKEIVVERRTTGVDTSLDWVSESVPFLPLGEFLTPPRLRVLWFLDSECTPEEIEPFLPIGRERVRQLLVELEKRQLATRNGKTRLREEFSSLHSLAHQLFAHYQRESIREAVPEGSVVWTGPEERLLTLPDGVDEYDDDEFVVTGLAAAERWGLKFRSWAGPLLYGLVSEDQPTVSVEEVIAHILRRRTDNRRIEYAALLAARAVTRDSFDSGWFETVAEHYGVQITAGFIRPLVVLAGTPNVAITERDSAEELNTSLLRPHWLSDVTSNQSSRVLSQIRDQYPSPKRVAETAAKYDVEISTAAKEFEKI